MINTTATINISASFVYSLKYFAFTFLSFISLGLNGTPNDICTLSLGTDHLPIFFTSSYFSGSTIKNARFILVAYK